MICPTLLPQIWKHNVPPKQAAAIYWTHFDVTSHKTIAVKNRNVAESYIYFLEHLISASSAHIIHLMHNDREWGFKISFYRDPLE